MESDEDIKQERIREYIASIGDEVLRKEENKINHPSHYTSGKAECECGKQIECIDITKHQNFCIGNAIKYLWRAEHKGAHVQDLKKAIWYIQCEIERIENEV